MAPNQRDIQGLGQQDTQITGTAPDTSNNRTLGPQGNYGPQAGSVAGAPSPADAVQPQQTPEEAAAAQEATEQKVQADRTKKLQFVAAELKRMRYFRRQYDIRRAHFYRQYLGYRDDKFYPDNVTRRSNSFVPYPLSNIENIVTRVLDFFFGVEDWFETKEKPPYSTDDMADQMQMVMSDKLHRAKFRQAFEELVRNLAIYGHNGIKVDWDFRSDAVITKEPVYQPDPTNITGQALDITGQPIIIGYQPKVVEIPRSVPRFTVIDVYDLLVDPDGAYLAHLTERTWRDLKEEAKANPDLYFKDGMDQLQSRLSNEDNPDEIIIRLAEFWNNNDQTWTILTFGEDPEGISFKDLRASFRATSYSPYKRRIYGGETIMLWDGPNPFMHGRSPILYSNYIKLPNEMFGLGAIEIITDLSEALNRFVNMIADNWNLGINHRYAFDINAEIDHDSLNSFNVPGGKVGVVGDPSKVLFPLPQFTPNPQDYQILELYRGMIEMASGVSDFYDRGMGSSKGNKTATGISQIAQETNYRMKTFIRNLELDIIQPMLEMVASMTVQFSKESFSVPNSQAPFGAPQTLQINPEDLIGTYAFNITSGNYMTNKVVRQRNLMALAGLLENNPYIDPYVATRELLKNFDIPHVDKLMKSPQQVQMEQQQQQQQQLQMMLLQHQLDTDQKVKVAEAKGPEEGPPGSGGKKKTGKKPKFQKEGPIPGSSKVNIAKESGQQMGAGALGLGGLTQIPNAGV